MCSRVACAVPVAVGVNSRATGELADKASPRVTGSHRVAAASAINNRAMVRTLHITAQPRVARSALTHTRVHGNLSTMHARRVAINAHPARNAVLALGATNTAGIAVPATRARCQTRALGHVAANVGPARVACAFGNVRIADTMACAV